MHTTDCSFKKILWAVDAHAKEIGLQAQTGRAIRAVVGNGDATVTPVSVLPMMSTEGVPAINNRIAEKNLEKLFRLVKLEHREPPQLLQEAGRSMRSAVGELIRYADEKQADLIAVGTHGRKGMPRFFMGSFAETLILHSPLPVLVTNPKAKMMRKVRHILFPTDFTEKSVEIFERVLDLAESWNADVLVYHRLEYLYPELGYPFVVPPVSAFSIQELIRAKQIDGAKLVELAERRAVVARFHLCQRKEDIPTSIFKAAKHLPDSIIAMASQTGPIASYLLGSCTRQVVRQSTCPVLVFHPKRAKAAENSPQFGYPRAAGDPLLAN